MRKSERTFILALLLVASGLLGLDRLPARAPSEGPPAGGRFLSVGWYCPLPPGEGVSSSVSMTNFGDSAVLLRRWGLASSRTGPFLDATLPPMRRASVDAKDFGVPDASGVVEAFGSATSADTLSVDQGGGAAAGRCSGQPGSKWYFGVASTLRGRDSYLLIANPFQEEAVVKVRLLTREGSIIPARLKDLVVPKLSQGVVLLAEYFQETDFFGVEAEATRGRIVISRFDRIATRDPWRGLALRLGSRELSTKWFMASGEVPTDGEEFIHIANPSNREALAQVIFQTDTEQLAQPGLQEIRVPAGRIVSLPLSEHLPRGTRHGSLVASTNGVPFVVERQTFGAMGAPRGYEASAALSGDAQKWVLSVTSGPGVSQAISVVNFRQSNAVFRITLLTGENETHPPELSAIAVEAGRRATIDLSPFVPPGGAAAVIEAVRGSITVEGRIVFADPVKDFTDLFAQPL